MERKVKRLFKEKIEKYYLPTLDEFRLGFEYEFNNKKLKYYPDFILEDGSYVEIKGYPSEQVKSKIKQFKYNIQVLYREEMQLYIDYVKNKYGNNFIHLYENNEHKLNNCKLCGVICKNKYCSRLCAAKAPRKK